MIRTSSETQGQLVVTIEWFRLQYSSQIVETDTVSLEFSGKFLRFLPLTLLFSLSWCALSLPNVEPRVFWSTETTVIPKSTLGKCFKSFDEDCSCPWVSEDALRTKRPKLLPNFVPRFSLLVGENPGNEVVSYIPIPTYIYLSPPLPALLIFHHAP